MREGGRRSPCIRCNIVRISIENFSLDLMGAVKIFLFLELDLNVSLLNPLPFKLKSVRN
jgi:hypothetical protein